MTDPASADPGWDDADRADEASVVGEQQDVGRSGTIAHSVWSATSAIGALLWRGLRALGRLLRFVGRILLRWRAPLILVPLIIGLGLAALIGAQMLWQDVPKTPAAPPTVTCWDGSSAPRTECALPSGPDGLHWVYPSFRSRTGRCDLVGSAGGGTNTPLKYDCDRRVLDKRVTITYTQRSTLKQAQNYLTKRYPGIAPTKQAGGERLLYRDEAPRGDGTFEVTVAYAESPFAVTVTGASLKIVDAALDTLVTQRPARFLTVRPD